MSDTPDTNVADRPSTTRLVDLIFEAGMLRKTPRTGYQFLGSGGENVAEHSFRTAFIGYILAQMAGANAEHTALLCLLHDFHEARIGDFNYVNKIYNSANERQAMEHAAQGTGLENPLLALWDEQNTAHTPEAAFAADADQLDLIFNLIEARNLGNTYAAKWLEAAIQRLHTPQAQELAATALTTDHTDWWFKGPSPDWWTRKTKFPPNTTP